MSTPPAFQDYYPDDVAHCFGCGRLNEHGHQLKTYWDGDETVTRYRPQPYHTAVPGYVYGGLVASLIDCHGTGTAAAAAARLAGLELDWTTAPSGQAPRYVTAALTEQNILIQLLALFGTIASGAGIYGLALFVFRLSELRLLVDKLLGRFRR